MDAFWRAVEEEIDQMSRIQKVFRLVIITIAIIGLEYAAGCLTIQLWHETINIINLTKSLF